jgi:hypothetical protein
MHTTPGRHLLGFAVLAAAVIITIGDRAPAAQSVQPAGPNEQAALKAFKDRLDEYVALHRKLEATLPKLPQEATPQQIDQNQRKLGALIQEARKGVPQGHIFNPEMTRMVKGVMTRVFGGPEGQKLRSSMMDENVAELPLTVNQRWPDTIPMATMPPAILKSLPTLPEQMQYRFVASQFVLLDHHAHLVADFIPAALPSK